MQCFSFWILSLLLFVSFGVFILFTLDHFEYRVFLFDDLYEFYRTELSDNYFLGTIVLIKEEDKPYADVIDGQQRLTTLTILFSVLVSNLTGKARESCNALLQESGNILAGIPARPRIHLRQRDQAFFNKYIQEVQIPSLISIAATALSTEV